MSYCFPLNRKVNLAVLVVFLCFLTPAKAQLTVTGGLNLNDIRNLLFGPDVTIANFQVNCPNGAYGSFNGGNSNIGLTGGILLTTGNINVAVGPNNIGDAGRDNNAPGDTDLDDLVNGGTSGCVIGGPCTQTGCNGTMTTNGVCTCTNCADAGTSFDACSIEFDITPTCDQIQIRYVFGS
ncbi:MAG: choice-of-anchor L domain-containing protein [Flavobacteriales bacterium]|nr:choice-of-anchor L domain-containing protein [Flavobacteriales bacterium]